MNALNAVFITIGVIIALIVVGHIVVAIDDIIGWDKVGEWGCFLVVLIVPTPLMIVGVATNTNLGTMIIAEVLTCIGSWGIAQNRDASGTWIPFVPLLPTIIFLIACIASDIVVGAIILVIVGFLQFVSAWESSKL